MNTTRKTMDIPDNLRFCGMYIRKLRTSYDLSQYDMAMLLGTTANNICAIEQGRHTPGPAILTNTVRAFGVSADWLMGLSPDDIGIATLQQAETHMLAKQGSGSKLLRSCAVYKDPSARAHIYMEEKRKDILLYASVMNTGDEKLIKKLDAENRLKKCLGTVE